MLSCTHDASITLFYFALLIASTENSPADMAHQRQIVRRRIVLYRDSVSLNNYTLLVQFRTYNDKIFLPAVA